MKPKKKEDPVCGWVHPPQYIQKWCFFLIRKTKVVQTSKKKKFKTLFLPWFEMHVWCVCIELALVAQQVVTNNPIHLFAKRKSSKTLYLLSNLAWILVLKKISETITIIIWYVGGCLPSLFIFFSWAPVNWWWSVTNIATPSNKKN